MGASYILLLTDGPRFALRPEPIMTPFDKPLIAIRAYLIFRLPYRSKV